MQIPAIELTLFWMMIAVLAVALLTRRIRLPYTVALVIAGLLIAVTPGTPGIELTPDIILAVFLPTLIFEAAYNLDFGHLRENLRPITILAIPGVLLTAAVVAAFMHFIAGFDWGIAFLFGAIVSATDPISVVATFKALGAPMRLRTILEGESLFNDGTSIVVFNLVLAIVLSGHFNPFESLAEFVVVVAGGLVVGASAGYVASFVLSRIDDYLIETVVTIVVAYGTFFLAEQFHVSGVIALVAAGLLVGNYAKRVSFSPTSRIAVGLSWDLFGFIANSLIFLLVGLQLKVTRVENALGLIALAIVAVLLSRALVVWLTGWSLRVFRLDRPLPYSWQVVLVWGGLRGAISLALALSIPVAVGSGGSEANRDTILAMTFGVILFTLLVQGLTMQPLLKRLRLVGRATELTDYESAQAQLSAIRAAINALEQQARRGEVSPDVVAELRAEYEARESQVHEQLSSLNVQNATLRQAALVTQRRALLQVEKSTLRDLFTRGAITEEILRDLSADIDRRLHDDDAVEPAGGEVRD